MTALARFAEAAAFAAEAHRAQTRKGAAADPYVNHVLDVAARLAAARPEDEALAVAAVLHDVVEDCDVTSAALAERFGPVVAGIVAEVTDDGSLPKAERKRLQVEKAPRLTPSARRLKLADKASNLTALATDPPPWPPERRRAYLDWARAVAEGCRGVDPTLEAAFDAAAARLEAALAATGAGD
ncbi:MAG TPA: HD domain-containing protein [Paracoccaceae bacterium]|nr:HD domain-containing protein [Paracoccaceae bacterium]